MCLCPDLCTGLLQQVAEEAAGGLVVHSSAGLVVVVLGLADVTDLRISCLGVHEDQSADACVRSHGIAVGQLDSETLAAAAALVVAMVMLVVTLIGVMAVVIAAAGAVVSVDVTVLVAVSRLVWVVQLGAFAKESEDVLLQGVVRTT